MFNVIINPDLISRVNFSYWLSEAKRTNHKGCYVSYFESDHFTGATIFLTSDCSVGFAVKNGELIALFKNKYSKHKNVAHKAIPLAKLYGARRLECFEPLKGLYEQFGFQVLTSTPWNDEYSPDDWNVPERPRYLTMVL
mgnify:CR=1 FL=1